MPHNTVGRETSGSFTTSCGSRVNKGVGVEVKHFWMMVCGVLIPLRYCTRTAQGYVTNTGFFKIYTVVVTLPPFHLSSCSHNDGVFFAIAYFG